MIVKLASLKSEELVKEAGLKDMVGGLLSKLKGLGGAGHAEQFAKAMAPSKNATIDHVMSSTLAHNINKGSGAQIMGVAAPESMVQQAAHMINPKRLAGRAEAAATANARTSSLRDKIVGASKDSANSARFVTGISSLERAANTNAHLDKMFAGLKKTPGSSGKSNVVEAANRLATAA